MQFKAFISYRHSENGRRHAIALETALKRYAKPTLVRPMRIFRDEKHMKPDVNLSKLVKDGLENSEYLIFLAEKASADSHWCCEELEFWCNPAGLNRTENLIIILIDDDIVLNKTQSINFEETTALPGLLGIYLTSIPLYVDLRWAKTETDLDLQHPKYRHEVNALAARLRGVNPEDLNDEEIRVFRRNIRLRNGAITLLLGMLLIAVGTAWWAVKQQEVAEASTIEAQKQKNIAEKALAAKIEEETQKR
jgi:TIR domain